MPQMKIDRLAVSIEVDSAIGRKRRQRSVHQSGLKAHGLNRKM
jgi:hypothetical protein